MIDSVPANDLMERVWSHRSLLVVLSTEPVRARSRGLTNG
jgi:hypothetical protein